MNRFVQASAIALAASSLGACATVTRGTNTAWEVKTTPPGAQVSTSNRFHCDSTPCSIKMPRKSRFNASIAKPGYKTVTIEVTNKVAGAGGAGMAGNVLLGGIIGAGVDVASGAMLDLTPNPVDLALEADPSPPPAATANLTAPATAPLPAMSAPAPQAGVAGSTQP